jgi:hypothetical protein
MCFRFLVRFLFLGFHRGGNKLLRCVRWFETDVSGLDIGPVFKGQAVQEV